MRPERPDELLAHAARVLRAPVPDAATLVERLGRPLWIDFVSDTGDDRDLSAAVARLVFTEYAPAEDRDAPILPRGDILLFGGDTAYPVATGREICGGWSSPGTRCCRRSGPAAGGASSWASRETTTGMTGWTDSPGSSAGTRWWRCSRTGRRAGLTPRASGRPGTGAAPRWSGSSTSTSWRDPSTSSDRRTSRSARSSAGERSPRRAARAARLHARAGSLALGAAARAGPRSVGCGPAARRLDFRQRTFFIERRAELPDGRLVFLAPDPALSFGEPNPVGRAMLAACHLTLESDRVLYLSGDLHHYERRAVGESLHVIAGGGGAFLHGTRIPPSPHGPATRVYPDAATSRRLALSLPWKLMAGTAGFLPHMIFGVLGAIQIRALGHGPVAGALTTALVALVCIVGFTLAVRSRRARPVSTLAVTMSFGLALALSPLLLRWLVLLLAHGTYHDVLVVLAHAALGAFLFGAFLMTLALIGLEHEDGSAALGHPGFRHFVRIRVDPGGGLEAWVIGKDDPLGPGPAVLIDRFAWPDPGTGR